MTQCWETNNSEFSFHKLFPDTTNYRLGWAKSSRIEEMCLEHIFPVINFITFAFPLSPVPCNDKVSIRYRHSIWGREQWAMEASNTRKWISQTLFAEHSFFLYAELINFPSDRRARAWTKIKVQVLFIFLLLLSSLQLRCARLRGRERRKMVRWDLCDLPPFFTSQHWKLSFLHSLKTKTFTSSFSP